MFMLDSRSFRDEPIELFGLPVAALPPQAYERGRTMLGSAQLRELLLDLKDAHNKGITWKFVLVPEPIQNLGWFLASDRFEGYARERAQILDYIQSFCIANVVFISGDIHASIANNLTYKKQFLDLKRYSQTWDISTGPVAYKTPYGQDLIDKLNATTFLLHQAPVKDFDREIVGDFPVFEFSGSESPECPAEAAFA